MQQEETKTKTEKRQAPKGYMMRRMVAAVCAICLLAGGAIYYSGQSDVARTIENSFSVQTYAAADGKAIKSPKNKIIFDNGSGNASEDYGLMSGALFKVVGKNIDKVHVQINKEAIYRQNAYNYSEDEANSTFDAGTTNGDDIITGYDEKKQLLYANTGIGNNFTDHYDKSAMYGFMLTKETYNRIEKKLGDEVDMDKVWYESMDVFDGAKMTITVTFKDGKTETQNVTLHTGKVNAKDPSVLVDEDDEKTEYVYTIYGEIKE